MKCLVCESEMLPYVVKDFSKVCGLGKVDYSCCEGWGLAVAKNIYEMSG